MATLNIPIDDELKRILKASAAKAGKTLQAFVSDALRTAVSTTTESRRGK